MVPTPLGEEKLSAALLDLVAPFMPHVTTLSAFRALVGIGVAAWNSTLLQGSKRQSFLKQIVQPLLAAGGEEGRDDAKDIFNILVKRKERYFADDKRFIISYTVHETRNEFRVAVATTVMDFGQALDK